MIHQLQQLDFVIESRRAAGEENVGEIEENIKQVFPHGLDKKLYYAFTIYYSSILEITTHLFFI